MKPADLSAPEGSTGFVRVSSMSLPSPTEDGAENVAVGATLSTLTSAVYVVTAPSLSLTLPTTARVPLSCVGHVREAAEPKSLSPPPQPNANSRLAASTVEGSTASSSDSTKDEPSLTGPVAAKVAVGATLCTTRSTVYVVTPPSLSRTDPLTFRGPLSFVGQLCEGVALKALGSVPSPQSKANVNPAARSVDDGSAILLRESWIGLPSSTS